MKSNELIESIIKFLQETEEIEKVSNEEKKAFLCRIEELRKKLFLLGWFDYQNFRVRLNEREKVLADSIVW